MPTKKNLLSFLFGESQEDAALDASLLDIFEAAAAAEKFEMDVKPLEQALKALDLSGKGKLECCPAGCWLTYSDQQTYLDDLAKLMDIGNLDTLAGSGWVAANGGDDASTGANDQAHFKISFLELQPATEGGEREPMDMDKVALEMAAPELAGGPKPSHPEAKPGYQSKVESKATEEIANRANDHHRRKRASDMAQTERVSKQELDKSRKAFAKRMAAKKEKPAKGGEQPKEGDDKKPKLKEAIIDRPCLIHYSDGSAPDEAETYDDALDLIATEMRRHSLDPEGMVQVPAGEQGTLVYSSREAQADEQRPFATIVTDDGLEDDNREDLEMGGPSHLESELGESKQVVAAMLGGASAAKVIEGMDMGAVKVTGDRKPKKE